MNTLLNIGAGYRSQIIAALAVALWVASSTLGLVTPEQLDSGVQILGIVFGGTFAAKVNRLVSVLSSPEYPEE